MEERKLVTSDWHEMPDHLMVFERIEITVTHFVRRLALDSCDSFVVVLILLAVWKQKATLLCKFYFTFMNFY